MGDMKEAVAEGAGAGGSAEEESVENDGAEGAAATGVV